MDRSEKLIILTVVIAVLACGGILLCGTMALLGSNLISLNLSQAQKTATSVVVPPVATIIPTQVITPIVESEDETFSSLQAVEIPEADPLMLAEKYLGKVNIPRQLTTAPIPYELGDQLDFYVLDTDTNQNNRITATLRYASATTYFWAENGVTVNATDLNKMMEIFEEQIYPTNQEFFGKEWIPGVDNDPHLYILYARNLGGAAGYTAGNNTVLPAAIDSSNAHEMFYVNADVQTLTDPYTLSVMAHEFQHLIHGYRDSNEELWLNEGFSELSTLLNGYETGGFDYVFSNNTDIQLNDWPVGDDTYAHYGASFLYVTYLLDRFGDSITREIVAEPENGFGSIDKVFSENQVTDEMSDELITADDFFMDWTISNFLMDSSLYGGRFNYSNYSGAPTADTTEVDYACMGTPQQRTVKQYGTDYIEIQCPSSEVRVNLTGAPTVPVLPLPAISGRFMWSNRADNSATTLSREFDFTSLSGPISMNYKVWYDLEKDYDFVYLVATTDGVRWEMVNPPGCTSLDLNGSNYGCGYNGSSGDWVSEVVDLSQFAGKKVTLSFEYITDEAVTAEGFILDDIEIPSIGYAADFEQDDGGWITKGFVNIENSIPQTFLVSIFSIEGGAPLQKFQLASGEELGLLLPPLSSSDRYVIAISGSSRYTRQEASYQFIIKQN